MADTTKVAKKQCNKCKVNLPVSHFRTTRAETLTKQCIKCLDFAKEQRERQKCEHGKRRSNCKECGGGSICEHGRERSKCKECGGASICEHNRLRQDCKECGGASICEHNIQRVSCKECDPNGYLAQTVRSRVRDALKNNRELSSQEHLDCDIQTFREHIEAQFKDGMSWENHGEWHIDHVIPIKYKEDGEEPSLEVVMERLHYSNTQPLWAVENISKGNRFIG